MEMTENITVLYPTLQPGLFLDQAILFKCLKEDIIWAFKVQLVLTPLFLLSQHEICKI